MTRVSNLQAISSTEHDPIFTCAISKRQSFQHSRYDQKYSGMWQHTPNLYHAVAMTLCNV